MTMFVLVCMVGFFTYFGFLRWSKNKEKRSLLEERLKSF